MSFLKILAEPLSAASFAPYGMVFEAPGDPGRMVVPEAVRSYRPAAVPALGVTRLAQHRERLHVARVERHAHSTQTFIPMSRSSFVLVVATPSAVPPGAAQFHAFVGRGGQGFSYAPAVWHHPIFAIGQDTTFTTLIWRAHDGEDELFADLAEPFEIRLPPVEQIL